MSSRLFDYVWSLAHSALSARVYWPNRDRFFKYLKHGWMRPDLLPTTGIDDFKNSWFDFLETLDLESTIGPGKIDVKAGLYKDWYYLEQYQSLGINKIRSSL